MKSNKKMYLWLAVVSDLFAAGLAWTFFYVFRKSEIETAKFGKVIPIEFNNNLVRY